MVWNSVDEFLHMGGYGLYVWGSAVVTFGFMLSEVVLLRVRRKAAIRQLSRTGYIDSEDTGDNTSGDYGNEG